MDDLQELYQEVILDHSKRPRNFEELEAASCKADGHNPLCGDRFTVYLNVKNGVIENASFSGSGCAISTASASLMTEMVKGKTAEEAKNIFENFHHLVSGEDDKVTDAPILGKLKALAGVRAFPMRVKCATLAWHTLNAAMKNDEDLVTTE